VLFASDVPCRLVLAKRHELRVTQVTIASPFEEIDLCDEHWFQPAAVLHLRRGETRTPPAGLGFGQIREGAFRNCQAVELLEESSADHRCETVARAACIHQAVAFVVPEDQCIERVQAHRLPADNEFLTAVDAHLLPGARSQAGLVQAVNQCFTGQWMSPQPELCQYGADVA
jgi:hypothetical protein